MNRWGQGRATVEALIAEGRLERVTPAPERAADGIARARARVATAQLVLETDPEAAYVLVYEGARHAMAAVLAIQGLRATSRGGHGVLYEALRAQLDPPLGSVLAPFNRMRIRRNEVEYRAFDTASVTYQEVTHDLSQAESLIATAERVIAEMPVF